jgi:hypothetical protein
METISISELRTALHELNNVFTIIVSSADLMLLETCANEETEQDLRNILTACERGKEILEEVRAKAPKTV